MNLMMKNRFSKVIQLTTGISLLLSVLLVGSISLASDYHLVTRVIDGDTIIIDNNEKIRLIGVDTPETVHPNKPVEYFGKQASAFTKGICEGKRVYLEYDQTMRDKYGRLLAYVYLENGTHINAEIIKQGYGHAYTRFPFKYMEEFRGYERYARESGIGLWGKQHNPELEVIDSATPKNEEVKDVKED